MLSAKWRPFCLGLNVLTEPMMTKSHLSQLCYILSALISWEISSGILKTCKNKLEIINCERNLNKYICNFVVNNMRADGPAAYRHANDKVWVCVKIIITKVY